jgi:uncharacterized membrane protein YczE
MMHQATPPHVTARSKESLIMWSTTRLSEHHRRDRFHWRLTRLGLGLGLYGSSIALMLVAGLGVDSWDVLHQGIASRAGLSFGTVVNLASVGVLIAWIPLRQRPGLGTVANAAIVGLVADLVLRVLTTPGALVGRIGMLALGIVANGVATGLYIGAGLGPGPRDGLMTGLAARSGRSIRSVRTGIELAVLGAGWLLGGPVGIGTLAYAVSIGPLSQYFIARLALGGIDRSAAAGGAPERPGADRSESFKLAPARCGAR